MRAGKTGYTPYDAHANFGATVTWDRSKLAITGKYGASGYREDPAWKIPQR
jgi:hypothetical protein